MAEFDPDLLFRRFRERRDVAALGELFDGAAPQLARVAWHLVHDAAEVEDLVQATFLTALDSADKFDAQRAVMPWLLGILAHHAHNARRAAGRRPRELEVDVLDPRAPESEAERRELREAVERAVAELPDTYREVVANWLIGGASPGEIATRTGKPGATVRVQLHRGLELLRQGLPAGIAALCASNGWSQGSATGMRAAVVARASEVARTLVPTSATIAGGAFVATKTWLTAVAVIAAVALVWTVSRDAVQPALSASAPIVDVREPTPLPGSTPSTPSTPRIERSEVAGAVTTMATATAPISRPHWVLIGTVAGAVGSDDARLSWSSDERWDFTVRGERFEVDLSALIVDRAAASLTYTFEYDHPRFLPATYPVTVPAQVDLERVFASDAVELRAEFKPEPISVAVSGRVLARADDELTRVRVALFALDERGDPGSQPTETVWCAPDGSFRVRSPRNAVHALLAALPGLRPATLVLPPGTGGEADVGTVVLQDGEVLSGRILGVHGPGMVIGNARDAEPSRTVDPPRARIPRAPEPGLTFVWRRRAFEWRSFNTEYGPDGSFSIKGLGTDVYRVDAFAYDRQGVEERGGDDVALVSFGSAAESVELSAPNHAVEWDAHERILCLDVRIDGVPVRGASIEIDNGGRERCRSSFPGHLVRLRWNGEASTTVRILQDSGKSRALTLDVGDVASDAFRIVELQ